MSLQSPERLGTLTENIEAIDNGDSWPSTIVIHGDTAFPVVSFTESQRAFIAAARVGDGKVMHWAHESYFYGTSEEPMMRVSCS